MICPYCKKEIVPIEEPIFDDIVIKDEKGRMKTWTEVTKDIEGKQIQKRIDEYVYYPSGEIDTIAQKVYGVNDNLVLNGTTIKHFKDGRKPIIQDSKELSL